MYLKNLTRSLRVRISEDDYKWLIMWADELGISVSDFIRQLIRKDRAQTISAADEDFISFLEGLDSAFLDDNFEGSDDDGNQQPDFIHIV